MRWNDLSKSLWAPQDQGSPDLVIEIYPVPYVSLRVIFYYLLNGWSDKALAKFIRNEEQSGTLWREMHDVFQGA